MFFSPPSETDQIADLIVDHMFSYNCTAREALKNIALPELPEKVQIEVIAKATNRYIQIALQF